ncbi:hypothetical protein ACWGTI_22030 [Mesorhizobium sp. ArgA1]
METFIDRPLILRSVDDMWDIINAALDEPHTRRSGASGFPSLCCYSVVNGWSFPTVVAARIHHPAHPAGGGCRVVGNTLPRGMIGFLIAIAGTFFVAIPGAAIGEALNRTGVPVTGEQLVWAAGGLYAVFVLAATVQSWLRLRRGDMNGARSAGARPFCSPCH